MTSRAGGEIVDVFKSLFEELALSRKNWTHDDPVVPPPSPLITKQTPMHQWVSLMLKTGYFSKSNVHADVLSYRRNYKFVEDSFPVGYDSATLGNRISNLVLND
jgi:hypothetical protein